jgi:hypothetical protein
MALHKFKDNHNDTSRHKNQTCEKCGVVRQWLGSPWHKWEYWVGVRETFVRPECVGKKIKTVLTDEQSKNTLDKVDNTLK